MKLIKLTNVDDDKSTYINIDNILLFRRHKSNTKEYTRVILNSVNDEVFFRAKETPEEIIKLINGEE